MLPPDLKFTILHKLSQNDSLDYNLLVYFVIPSETQQTTTISQTEAILQQQVLELQESNSYLTQLWQQGIETHHFINTAQSAKIKRLQQGQKRNRPQIKNLKQQVKQLQTQANKKQKSSISIIPTQQQNRNNNNKWEYTDRIKKGFLHIKHTYTLPYKWLPEIVVEIAQMVTDDWDQREFLLPDERTIRGWDEEADKAALAHYHTELTNCAVFHVHHDGSKRTHRELISIMVTYWQDDGPLKRFMGFQSAHSTQAEQVAAAVNREISPYIQKAVFGVSDSCTTAKSTTMKLKLKIVGCVLHNINTMSRNGADDKPRRLQTKQQCTQPEWDILDDTVKLIRNNWLLFGYPMQIEYAQQQGTQLEEYIPICPEYNITRWISRYACLKWILKYSPTVTAVILQRYQNNEQEIKNEGHYKWADIYKALQDPFNQFVYEWNFFMQEIYLKEMEWTQQKEGFRAAEMPQHVEELCLTLETIEITWQSLDIVKKYLTPSNTNQITQYIQGYLQRVQDSFKKHFNKWLSPPLVYGRLIIDPSFAKEVLQGQEHTKWITAEPNRKHDLQAWMEQSKGPQLSTYGELGKHLLHTYGALCIHNGDLESSYAAARFTVDRFPATAISQLNAQVRHRMNNTFHSKDKLILEKKITTTIPPGTTRKNYRKNEM